MKLTTLAITFLLGTSTTAAAWELRANGQKWTGTNPQRCTAVNIPKGAKISWSGSSGARTLQVYNMKGSCSRVYRTVQGVGDINASNNIYGFVVKA
ncbi:uncharacterized protein BO95DRAFT_441878 [Aspergillus brunneoviolaceus CBS 621.78]|uniref:Uncharacterized protein n=1 Tax=Aspergillus brunneoviolaceus CBS 621.78 TaxID=1450534 RepID=A0ACD1GBG8_9EURO|nr:hypothetical protein BO95DRAFT_441878 [Aspergillus brunneoviolaceus CBS 621.78]RAH46635.1 hypothetical protein BO95DRAFT_441878 [Aspergillus brunneoviolaceus CBS 621.78]